ncbi:MAG: general secretion pathway protein C [Methyloprofundus sp.]|nr:MAG: general secretion pathway protein C [Methyloprofundus sp.]
MAQLLQYKKTLHTVATLLTIGSMFFAAKWTWKILEPAPIAPKVTAQNQSAPKADINNDLHDILSANLFKQQVNNQNTLEQQANIPKTRQQLFLHGIISSSKPENSIALIASKANKAALAYRQGDQLPNRGGLLHLILNDYVQIKHNGRLEKLLLIKAKHSKPLNRQAVRHQQTTRPNNLEEFKVQYQNNSKQVLTQFGLKKTAKGIVLSTQKGRLPSGLLANDIVTSINGNSINTLENNPQMLDELLAGEAIEIGLERNNRTIRFRVPQRLFRKWQAFR